MIGGVDETLEEEQSRTTSGRDASSTGGGFPTADGRAGTGGAGSYGGEGESEDLGDGEASGQGGNAGSGESGGGEQKSSGGGIGGGSGEQNGDSARGNVPTYDEDPDTFRRQICEAAGSESDPALRDALERECRKYGGTPAGG